MHRYYVEFLGTFLLVVTIGLVSMSEVPEVARPIAVASVLIAAIYAGGHVSNAHFNPAVSLAFFVRGQIGRAEFRAYIGAQFAGALVGGFASILLRGASAVTASLQSHWFSEMLAEFIFTFMLVWVILNVATAKGLRGNSGGPIAIGLVVLGGAFAVADISRGAFNPAVTLSLAVMRIGEWKELGIYVPAQIAAATLASLSFDQLQLPTSLEEEPESAD